MLDAPADLERRHTIEWQDPHATAAQGLSLAGLDYIRAIRDGRLPPPPIAKLIGFDIAEVEKGRIVMTLRPGEQHYNPLGIVHGGVAATLLDSVMGCAIHSTLPAGTGFTTLEIKVNYLRALTAETGEVRAEGTVVHAGRQTAVAEGRIVDPAGRVCAVANTTCLIVKR